MLLEATQSQQVKTSGQSKLNFFKPKEINYWHDGVNIYLFGEKVLLIRPY